MWRVVIEKGVFEKCLLRTIFIEANINTAGVFGGTEIFVREKGAQ